jgi:hypothetical protein
MLKIENNNLLSQEDIQNLCSKGFVVINLPEGTSKLLKKIALQLDDFYNEPPSIKAQWATDSHLIEQGLDPDENWIQRLDKEHDPKAMFHYRSSSRAQLKGTAAFFRYGEMLEDLRHLWQIGNNLTVRGMVAIADYLEEELGYNFMDIYYESSDPLSQLLRALRYEPKAEQYAKHHIDRSAFTLAFPDLDITGKACTGLFLEGMDKPYVHKKDTAILFAGIKATVITDKNIQGRLAVACDTDWLGQDSLIQAPVHWADRQKRNLVRFTFIQFAHLFLREELSEEQISQIQKRITQSRGF